MKRFYLSVPAAFLATFVVATLIAIGMRGFVSPMFGEYIRTDADGLAFGPLIFGYFVVACALAWLIRKVQTGFNIWQHGATVGLALGLAVFLGDHSITAGWSKLPAFPMIVSGLLDTLAVVTSGIAASLVQGSRT